MEMALIHTVNAYFWPLLVLAGVVGVWKISSSIRMRRSAPRSAAVEREILDMPPAVPGREEA